MCVEKMIVRDGKRERGRGQERLSEGENERKMFEVSFDNTQIEIQ